MRVESSYVRAVVGVGVFVSLLAFFLSLMSPVMRSANPAAKAAYLFLAGPAGAMVTHLHVPLFALLVLILLPFVIAASVSRRRRKLMFALGVALWFLLGAMFASIAFSS
jgi:hypothetical protein